MLPVSLPVMSLGPPRRPRVLVVDDEPSILELLSDFLALEGYDVFVASHGAAALEELGRQRMDVVLSDLKMPNMGGIELLGEVALRFPDTVFVIMTGFGTVESAILAMKQGAHDYVLKPFKLDEVGLVIRRAVEKRQMMAENIRLREAVSLYKVSEAIANSLSLEQILETIVANCHNELGAELVSVWLEYTSGTFVERVMSSSTDTPRALSIDAIAEHFKRATGLLEHDGATGRFFQDGVPAVSLLVTPMRIAVRTIGYVCTATFAQERHFDEGQRKVLTMLAARAGAAIDNARLYEDLQSTFQQTIQGLAQTIDKMDRYTSGHSARVAKYAVFLARKLNLSESDVEIVRQSALMHDIGKIGCVINLNKPGLLTPDEFEVFKRHPVYGREILDPIRFLHPLIPGVHLHHERWDGNGYPLGLKASHIPIMARIISVADTYDAMTTDRSYRRALPHEIAVAEITRCSGSQFDPHVAGPFTEGVAGFREQSGEYSMAQPRSLFK